VSWIQRRGGPGAKASLHDTGRVEFELAGRSPQNEEDALEACARLVRWLNVHGADWGDPVPSIERVDDVDAWSTDRTDPAKKLQMQVVRASTVTERWATLARRGAVDVATDVEALAGELMAAITTKTKYPAEQRASLTLVLDATRAVSHTFAQVFDSDLAPIFRTGC
jgi:hypothetical protein